MFDINNLKNRIQKVTLNIGDQFGVEKEDISITLCEPDTFDTIQLNSVQKDEDTAKGIAKYFYDIFDHILVDHNLCDNGRKLTNAEVRDLIFKKFSVVSEVLSEYLNKVFPTPQSKKGKK